MGQKSLNNFLPQYFYFWGGICGTKYFHFWGAIRDCFRPGSGTEVLNNFLYQHIHVWGAIYGLFSPEGGTEVPERVPATTDQLFGILSMALSTQAVAQKSLNEFLPLHINFLSPVDIIS